MKFIDIRRTRVIAWLVLFLFANAHAQSATDSDNVIGAGSKVAIEFTIYLEDGSVFGGNEGGAPLEYEHGDGQLPPGLEAALVGLKADDRKKVELSPEEGYGQVNPEAFSDVAIDRVPADARRVGAILVVSDQSGNRRYVRVHEVGAETITIDLNHPLAGKMITFDVRVLTVE
ncbi:MAG: FKBP-type peptidyl-prolyl cis-trans isomerase [Gammaproteobacteria bacterium]|nr:FKBP-type peptidyl-prolyl cis-trans isomerase [Gammaproteobacteria bacterium]